MRGLMPSRLRANIDPVTDSYRSPLLSRPGAAALADPNAIDHKGVAWHYGQPLVEQNLRPAIVDRSHRVAIKVDGPDAETYLNNLLSQKMDEPAKAALDLDAQGHILHHTDLARVGDTFYLDVPRAQANTLLSYLQKMIFWSQVTVSETDLGILSIVGDLPLPDCAFSRRQAWRTDIAVDRALIDATVTDLLSRGAHLMGLMAFTALRVRALEPELSADLDAKSIPHESSFLIEHAVHLNKGCYRGQETVSRVHNLGKSPRVLVMLHLDGSAPTEPAIGDPITAGGRTVGRLGTIVHDADFGPIALGLVKRSALSLPLASGETALAIDPDSLPDDTAERPGRVAINKLRGLT